MKDKLKSKLQKEQLCSFVLPDVCPKMKIEETKQLRTGATQACKLRMPSGNQSRANRGVAKMEPLPHGKANDADKSPSRKDVTQLCDGRS
mmetsp:Transcript_20024/g.55738  ORF Transcript_20024/g.55738 Transcript_20024/m.55738 type:complete len:90 (-) Transcript_20024:352-621(-)|eukprot:373538-Pelagomonas_calceolata.AAC.1